MPNYALPPAQPLQTSIRSLRRSIGHPIHPTSVETFPTTITHVLLSRPTPCLALFAVLVDPSLTLVNLNNESFLLRNDILPPSDEARWAGAVSLSARSVWCEIGHALSGLRVSTFGALRPRGAGTAAPSTEIIRVLVSRAGAIVTDERPDIVLVAPGLSRRGVKIQKLLAENVLCLGAGFIVDLLLRLHANPQEYLAFPEQQRLCGPILDVDTARKERPLPVSKAVLERSEQSNPASSMAEAKATILRRPTRRQSKNNLEKAERSRGEEVPVSSKEDTYAPPQSRIVDDEEVQEAQDFFAATSPCQLSVRCRQQDTPKEKRIGKRNTQIHDPLVCKDEEVNAEYEPAILSYTRKGVLRHTQEAKGAQQQASSAQNSSTSIDKLMTTGIRLTTPSRDLRRADVVDIQQLTTDADSEPFRNLGCRPKESDRQPGNITSPITPAQNPPKRPRLDSSVIQESSTFHSTQHNCRSNLRAPTDDHTVTRRQLSFFGEDSNLGRCRPFSHSSQRLSDSIDSRKVNGHSFSVNDGFRFLFTRLGEPLQSDIDRLLRYIRNTDDVGTENESAEQNPEQFLIKRKKAPPDGSSPWDAESPLLDDEDDTFLQTNSSLQEKRTSDESGELLSAVTTRPNVSRLKAPKREPIDAFRIPIPRRRIILSNVISPETARFDRASDINVLEGHDFDDKTCQLTVHFVDWILGADNFVSISRDALHASPLFSRNRKLWSSLFESNALGSLAAPGAQPDSDIRTLTGVCIRLITSGASDDMKKMLAAHLQSVRGEQIRRGFDSLQYMLMASHSTDTSLHHKCVAAIWTCLLQSCIVNSDFAGAWEVFNTPLISRVDDIFKPEKLTEMKSHALEKELTNVLQDALVTSYMFSTRLDNHVCEEGKEVDLDDTVLHPENWRMIYYCMDKLCHLGRSQSYLNTVVAASTSFLRSIVVNIGGTVWPITDTLIIRTSQMIASLSSSNGKICFCDASSTTFENIWTEKDEKNVIARCSSSLKTMCDSLFVVAWLFTIRGRGSPMKRAMTVIRTGSSLTRSNEKFSGVSLHYVNHHIGMLMTLADSIAHSSKDGEYLVCKMLTSKCPRPAAMSRGNPTKTGETDAYWRATLLAIQKRCKILLSRGQSVQNYINWLSQNLVETLGLTRRSPGSRSASVSEKEKTRVHDSVFCSLAILIIEALISANRYVLASLQTDQTLRRKPKAEAIAEPATQITTYIKVSGDIISKIRSNPEESESKNKYRLLTGLFSLMNSQLLLLRQTVAPPLATESGSEYSLDKVRRLDERTLSFIRDSFSENIILQTICGGHPSAIARFPSSNRDIFKAAAGLLANLIELRTIRGDERIKCGENLVAILRQANMDATAQFRSRSKRNVQVKRAVPPDVEDSYRLVFWSEAVRCTWIVDFLQQKYRSHVIFVSAVLSLLVSMTNDWNVEDRASTIRLSKDCASFESLRYIFAPILSDINCLDSEDNSLSRVPVVEKSLRLLIQHWPTDEVHSILQLTHSRLKDSVGSSTGIRPDALILYSFSHALSAQLRGFNHVRVLHAPLSAIAHAVSRMTNSSRDHSEIFRMVQVRVLSSLCMVPSDMETRVLVLRVVNAFPTFDVLAGFWGPALLPTDEVPETWTKRAEKYAQDWRNFLFTSVIEDPLFSGRNVGCVIRRLAAASKGDEALRRLVQNVLVRGRGRLDFMLRRDGRAWREWSALCDDLLES